MNRYLWQKWPQGSGTWQRGPVARVGRTLLVVAVILAAVLFIAFWPRPGEAPNAPGDAPPVTLSPTITPPDTGSGEQPTPAAGPRVTVHLQGLAADQTLPTGSLTLRWDKLSGPGPVVFADPTVADTTATFYKDGVYVLRLTASDGEYTVSDDVTVTVTP